MGTSPSPSQQALTLDMFIRAVQDMERTQFEILHGLKQVRSNFHHNKIYPDLAHLIELYGSLQTIMDNASALQQKYPRILRDVNLEENKLLYEELPIENEHFATIRELIDWALPHIQTAIEEGSTICEFVDDNLSLEVVGILPSYLEEGYFFVPDNMNSALHLIKYEISIFTGSGERYRSLKTSLVKSVARSTILRPMQELKLELVREFPDLPNPATYSFATDLEFPFSETIFPLAKRQLLRHLFS